MIGLLDVNVLVALIVPEHEHHAVALRWFTTQATKDGWATCSATELGVIRVCAQLPGGSLEPERTADQLLLLTAATRGLRTSVASTSGRRQPDVTCRR